MWPTSYRFRGSRRNAPLGQSSFTSFWLFSQGRIRSSGAASRYLRSTRSGDLRVAIQDAMGWLDYHLHEFRLLDATERNVMSIGIPTDDDPSDRPVTPGWQVSLSTFFDQRNWHAPPATTGSTSSCMRASSQPMTTAGTRVVSPVKVGVRRRTAVVFTAMPSSSRSSPIPITRSTNRRFSGPVGASTLRCSTRLQ